MRLSRGKPSAFTRAWTQRQRFALLALIGANAVAFTAQFYVETYEPGLIREFFGLSDFGVRNAYGWQFITAAFLHAGAWHFAVNVIALYLVGRDVESIIGQRNFLLLYLAGAGAGELGHLFLMPTSAVLYGSSGGVAAVLFAYATILPELELTSPFFFLLPIRLKAKHLAYVAVAVAAIMMVVSRDGIVIHSATLGGCFAGWVYAHLLGFGRPSFIQRRLRQRRASADRLQAISAGQFIVEEVDPLLEKIAREGIGALTRQERRTLALAREKLTEQDHSR